MSETPSERAAMTAPGRWPQADGEPVACREKVKQLEENHDEAGQVLQDAFEDAILMGVDERFMREALHKLVDELRSPTRR